MPIRRELRPLYRTAEFLSARERVRARSRGRCEWCRVANRARGYRDERGRFHRVDGTATELAEIEGRHIIRIVLTTAHLDHNPRNNHPKNLAVLCQRCHLLHDRDHHIASRAGNVRRAREAAGQRPLWHL